MITHPISVSKILFSCIVVATGIYNPLFPTASAVAPSGRQSPPLCSLLLEDYKVVHGEENHDKGSYFYRYRDFDYGFLFEAELKEDGLLYVWAFLLDVENKLRSRYSGQQLYDLMMKHFRQKKIRGIVGEWVDGVNFEQYYTNRNNNMSEEASARLTWSGQQAAHYGFTQVDSVTYDLSEVDTQGRAKVWIIFKRPSNPSKKASL